MEYNRHLSTGSIVEQQSTVKYQSVSAKWENTDGLILAFYMQKQLTSISKILQELYKYKISCKNLHNKWALRKRKTDDIWNWKPYKFRSRGYSFFCHFIQYSTCKSSPRMFSFPTIIVQQCIKSYFKGKRNGVWATPTCAFNFRKHIVFQNIPEVYRIVTTSNGKVISLLTCSCTILLQEKRKKEKITPTAS